MSRLDISEWYTGAMHRISASTRGTCIRGLIYTLAHPWVRSTEYHSAIQTQLSQVELARYFTPIRCCHCLRCDYQLLHAI